MIDVVIHPQVIRDCAKRVNHADCGVQPFRRIRSSDRREGIVQTVIGITVLKSEIQIRSPTPAPSAASSASARTESTSATAPAEAPGGAKRVIEPDVDVIGLVCHGSDVMKVLNVARQVGRGYKSQKASGARIDHGRRNRVAGKGSVRSRIKDLY